MDWNQIYLGAFTFFILIVLFAAKRMFAFAKDVRFRKNVFRDVKAEPCHWFWGNMHNVKFGTEELFKKRVEEMKTFPKCTATWIGVVFSSLLVYFPSLVQEILTTNEPKDEFIYSTLKRWIGDGILISKGRKWKRNRRLLTGAFHFGMLKNYLKIFNVTASKMCDKWKGKTSLKAFENVALMTLDSMLQCAMSTKTDCQNVGKSHPYIKAVYDLTELATRRFFNPILASDFIFFKISSLGRRYLTACDVAHKQSQSVIDKRRKELQKQNGTTALKTQEHLYNQDGNMDFLDILLLAKDENGKGLTDREIRDEVDTFLFEGHDTTASGISWALYNLAAHPEYQEKCRNEVKEVLGNRDNVEYSDIGKLNYLGMFIKESLRMYPPVYVVSRKLSKPFHFSRGFGSDYNNTKEEGTVPPDAGKTFPASITVSILIMLQHR